MTATLLDCLFCPAFAWLISRLLPLAPPYATGLLLIGLAPAAPFLPMMVRRAGGDLAYAAAFMLIAALVTVLLMPVAVPLIVPGLVDPWTVAKPLLLLLFLPMAAGIAIKTVAPVVTVRLLKIVRPLRVQQPSSCWWPSACAILKVSWERSAVTLSLRN